MAESLPDLNRNASLAYVKVEPDEAEGLTALEEFGTKGLTSAQAAAQQAKWGRNEIPEEKEPLWRMFAIVRHSHLCGAHAGLLFPLEARL